MTICELQRLLERDTQLKDHREEALKTQKSLEKQLNEEMDHANELRIKLDKAIFRKDELKAECEEVKLCLDETKQAYEELTNKWKQKSELITDLDSRVRKMKENYELKEAGLVAEADRLR
jgi:leucine-rich repeat/coiled-coil domain-containing protein 1